MVDVSVIKAFYHEKSLTCLFSVLSSALICCNISEKERQMDQRHTHIHAHTRTQARTPPQTIIKNGKQIILHSIQTVAKYISDIISHVIDKSL